MKKMLFVLFCLITVVIYPLCFNFGFEFNGHIVPYITVGYKIDNFQFEAGSGFSVDFGETLTFIYEPIIKAKYIINDIFSLSTDFKIIGTSADERLLFMSGLELGYNFDKITLSILEEIILPFSAVNTIRGPIPMLKLNYEY